MIKTILIGFGAWLGSSILGAALFSAIARRMKNMTTLQTVKNGDWSSKARRDRAGMN